jgi:hypothetical protein
MADPITMAVVGGSIGAMTNKKDPLKGALLGAAGGYGGGALMGAGGLGAGASSGVLPSALSGSTTINAAAPMAGQAFVNPVATAMTTGPSGAMGVEAAKTGLFAGSPVTAPFVSSGTSTGMIPSSLYEPTFMDKVGSVGKYAQQNPVLTNMAMQSAQQAMQQPEAQFAPAGQVNRGQIQGGDYMSLLNPQQGTVLRPQPISLLG